jgi:hypothetical protein
VLPLGVTGETVRGILENIAGKERIESIIIVTTPGYEDVKKSIIEGVKTMSILLGARFNLLVIGFGDEHASEKIYRAMREAGSGKVYVSFVTGSRYLIPILMQAILRYAHDTGAEVYAIHGIEGGEYRIEPLAGYIIYKLNRTQREVFKLIYEHPGEEVRVKEDLIERYGFGRSIYKVLKGLEEKGLVIHRRNKVLKTYPGKLLYNLLREVGEV